MRLPTPSALAALLSCALIAAAPGLPAQDAGYDVNENWAQLPEDMTWNGATSWVAADGEGNILVLVRAAPHFRLFSRDGQFIRAWGEDGMFQNAHSVVFDGEGNIWATDAAAHVAYKFSPEGELLMTLGSKGEPGGNDSRELFNQANHVAVAPNGDLYVSDGYQNSRVMHFNADGEFQRIIAGTQGAGDGQLDVPHGVALDREGRILVNDSGNQRVSVFDAGGVFVETWPYPSRGGIVAADDGTVYVSDVNAGAVNILKDGELLGSVKVDARPHGLAVDTDGAIYVSDALGRTVFKITRR